MKKKNLTFGKAVKALKKGKKVARRGWNGKGMFIILVSATLDIMPPKGSAYSIALGYENTTEHADITNMNIDAHIDMFTAQGSMQPGWLASQADMLADDWELV